MPVFALAQNSGLIYSSAFLKNSAYLTVNGDMTFDGGALTNDGNILFLRNITGQDQETTNLDGSGDYILEQENFVEGNFAFSNLIVNGTAFVNDSVSVTNLTVNGTLNLASDGYLSAEDFQFDNDAQIRTLDNSKLELSIPAGEYTLPFFAGDFYSAIAITAANDARMQFSVKGTKFSEVNAQDYLNKFWALNLLDGSPLENAKFYYEDGEVVGNENNLNPLLFLQNGTLAGVTVNTDENYLEFDNAGSGIYTAASSEPTAVRIDENKIFAAGNLIHYRLAQKSNLIIYDVLGHKIAEAKETVTGAIPVSQSGVYIVRVISPKGGFTTKVFAGN